MLALDDLPQHLVEFQIGHAVFGTEWRFLSLWLSALNLLNEDYRTHGSGVNGYGRAVFATIAVKWRSLDSLPGAI